MKAVRVILEKALGLEPHELYARYLVAGTTRRHGSDRERLAAARVDPWAADMEASFKKLSMGVPYSERMPGDLVFDHNAAAPFGHVAVLLDRDTIVENIDPRFRPASLHLRHGSLSVTPLWERRWTLVVRLRSHE